MSEDERRLAALLDNVPVLLYRCHDGDDGSVEYASGSAAEITGYAPEELTSGEVGLRDLVIEGDRGRVREAVRQALAQRARFEIRYEIQRKDGTVRVVEDRGRGVYGEDGEVAALEGVIEDVTTREAAEKRLRETEQRYRSLVENVPVITYVQVPEPGKPATYTTAYMSPQVGSILGFSPRDFLNSSGFWDERVHPEDRARVSDEDERTDKTGEPFLMEYRMIARDGRVVWVRDEAALVRGDADEPLYWQGVISDITVRRDAEEKLQATAAELQALFTAIPDVIFVLDSEGRYLEVAPTNGSSLLVRPPADLLGKTLHEVLSLEQADMLYGQIQRSLETRQAVNVEYALSIDGSEVWFEGTISPIVEDRVLLMVRDITERRETVRALAEAEKRYRALVERTPIITYAELVVDEESVSTYVSPQAEKVLGYPAEQLNGSPPFWQELIHPDDREHVLAIDDRVNKTGEPFVVEYRMLTADGRILWVHDEAVLVSREENAQHWQGFIVDITERRQAEERLREAETRFRTLVEQLPAVTYIDSAAGSFESLYTSPQIETMLGYTPEEWRVNALWNERLHPDDRERVLAADDALEVEGEPFSEEYRLLARDGRVVWVSEKAVLVKDAADEPLFWQGVILDVTERREAEEALRKSQANLSEAQRIAHVGSWEWNPTTGKLGWSDEVYRIYGYEPQQFVPTFEKFLEMVHPEDISTLVEAVDGALSRDEPYDFEHRIIRPDGAVRVIHRQAEVVRGDGGEPLHMVGTVHDVTDRRALQDRLEHQALHDPLTGLANRVLFTNRLEHALARAKRRGERVAVLFLDLDDFKIVNDSLGHEAGDKLLILVARRLLDCLRPEDTAARLGGDEFVVLLENAGGSEGAVRVADRIAEELRAPFLLGDKEIFVTASVGITVGGVKDQNPADIIRDADLAMYGAKRAGKARYTVFEEDMNVRALERLEIGNDLRRAIEREEFVVYYQPKLDMKTGVVAGFEALLRWQHPKRGLILPLEFISLAEETGLIVPLGRWVLQESCRQLAEWQRRYPTDPPLMVCVNLSARQFGDPYLGQATASVLRETHLDPRGLSLEITESTAMEDAPSTATTLEELKALGVDLAIDDFGTGYSSLSYLERFFVDFLKIDRSFIGKLGKEPGAAVLVSGMIDLAHALGLKVVAEGVETVEQSEKLKQMGCDMAQGYFFSRPLPAEDAERLLAQDCGR